MENRSLLPSNIHPSTTSTTVCVASLKLVTLSLPSKCITFYVSTKIVYRLRCSLEAGTLLAYPWIDEVPIVTVILSKCAASRYTCRIDRNSVPVQTGLWEVNQGFGRDGHRLSRNLLLTPRFNSRMHASRYNYPKLFPYACFDMLWTLKTWIIIYAVIGRSTTVWALCVWSLKPRLYRCQPSYIWYIWVRILS